MPREAFAQWHPEFTACELSPNPIVTLKKAASFLKPDGILIVHVPNAHAVNRKLAVHMGTLECCEELSPFDIHVAGHRRPTPWRACGPTSNKPACACRPPAGFFTKCYPRPRWTGS